MRRAAVLVLVTSLAAAGAIARWVAPAAAGPSLVVFGPQRLPLTFSHARHLGRAGATCVDCHDRAPTSRSAVDVLTPGEEACRACHAIDRERPAAADRPGQPPAACGACHPGWTAGAQVARVVIPPPSLKFSHAAHAASACTSCHGDLAAAGVGLATRDHLPTMDRCLTCHDGRTADRACTTCHLAGAGGRLRTDLADGRLVPVGGATGAVHGPDFRTHHARDAAGPGATCASCHQERFCSDCHLGVVKPMEFHAGDYLSLHAVEARRGVPDCSACHRTQSFCVGCHERSGVGVRAESGFDRSGLIGRYHPPGWAAAGGRGPDHHATEAQRNLAQCSSCHREDFCLECHTAEPGRVGPSPHGPGWRGSGRCRALAARNPRLCLRCHIVQAPMRCD